MAKIFNSQTDLVGRTPLMRAVALEKKLDLKARLLVKLELFNPAGSVKDRAALAMIDEAVRSGKLAKGGLIVEPTSGNTGIGIAAVGAAKGFEVVIVMPDTMSVERRQMIAAYGAKIVLSDGKSGMAGSIALAKKIAEERGGVLLGQFSNPVNAYAHFCTTGPEIFEDTDGNVDFFVAGVGTGGTISGVGRYLKQQNKNVTVVAVEPQSSAVLSGSAAGPHGIQGIGAGFVPDVLDRSVIDQIACVSDQKAMEFARLFARTEGILTGISSGAALAAAVDIAKSDLNAQKTVVALLPDSGDRYLSAQVFD